MNNAEMLDQPNSSVEAEKAPFEAKKPSTTARRGDGKRFVSHLGPDDEKAIKMIIAELGIDERSSTQVERNSAVVSLMVHVLAMEMEMARKALGVRFLSEDALKDYMRRKYQEVMQASSPLLF
ncbi:hypothetical protein D6779_00795 [Candidatus Parcubacteria bacterium]|nr:MAG: hypothetical protein D6779_00795 [Candidatus Parcubacteria bacterium]